MPTTPTPEASAETASAPGTATVAASSEERRSPAAPKPPMPPASTKAKAGSSGRKPEGPSSRKLGTSMHASSTGTAAAAPTSSPTGFGLLDVPSAASPSINPSAAHSPEVRKVPSSRQAEASAMPAARMLALSAGFTFATAPTTIDKPVRMPATPVSQGSAARNIGTVTGTRTPRARKMASTVSASAARKKTPRVAYAIAPPS